MKLATINRVLGVLRLVLVVSHGDPWKKQPIRLWVERISTYRAFQHLMWFDRTREGMR